MMAANSANHRVEEVAVARQHTSCAVGVLLEEELQRHDHHAGASEQHEDLSEGDQVGPFVVTLDQLWRERLVGNFEEGVEESDREQTDRQVDGQRAIAPPLRRVPQEEEGERVGRR
jgi:hypothetical protein